MGFFSGGAKIGVRFPGDRSDDWSIGTLSCVLTCSMRGLEWYREMGPACRRCIGGGVDCLGFISDDDNLLNSPC